MWAGKYKEPLDLLLDGHESIRSLGHLVLGTQELEKTLRPILHLLRIDVCKPKTCKRNAPTRELNQAALRQNRKEAKREEWMGLGEG